MGVGEPLCTAQQMSGQRNLSKLTLERKKRKKYQCESPNEENCDAIAPRVNTYLHLNV